jgi:hypothetical protein
MSTFDNKHYQEYKKHLAAYSECMKPFVRAVGEAFMNEKFPNAANLNLDEQCLNERKQVILARDILKGIK